MDDVERAERERGGEVGANAHRQRDPLAQRRRNRGADRDDVTDHAALQGAPSLEQVGGARRGSDDRDGVAAAAQCGRRAAHVLVDVVRL